MPTYRVQVTYEYGMQDPVFMQWQVTATTPLRAMSRATVQVRKQPSFPRKTQPTSIVMLLFIDEPTQPRNARRKLQQTAQNAAAATNDSGTGGSGGVASGASATAFYVDEYRDCGV